MAVRKYLEHIPIIGSDVYIDENALVIGKVSIGSGSSIWPMAVVRGDVNNITIGNRTSIQDGSILHTTRPSESYPNGFKLEIGDDVTVGHGAILHGCSIANQVLIGMGACVLDGAEIPELTYIAAKSLVPPNKKLTPGLWVGQPVKFVRDLFEHEIKFIVDNAKHYLRLSQDYISSQ